MSLHPQRFFIYLIITMPPTSAVCVTDEPMPLQQENVRRYHALRESFSYGTINAQNENESTPLINAIQHYDLRLVQNLLSAGADPCRADVEGYAPIHHAIYSPTISQGKLALITMLQRAGADINQPNSEGITPLMFAIIKYEKDLADLLVSDPTLGIVLDAQDDHGHTALHWSLKVDEPELALFLIRSGASAQLKPPSGESPLMVALRKNYLKIAEELIPGSDLSSTNNVGDTALFYAIKAGYVELIELFLKKDRTLADTATSGITPLRYTLTRRPQIQRQAALVRLLLAYGAHPVRFAEEGGSTLAIAQKFLTSRSPSSQSEQNHECLRLISQRIYERELKLESFFSQPPEFGYWPELIPTDIIILLLSFDES